MRQVLSLPAVATEWDNKTILTYFQVEQQKLVAFASGLQARLGAASGVLWLDEHALLLIGNEVMGRGPGC